MMSLDKLMKSKRAADRWDAFEMMFYAGGVKALDRAIGGLKNDIKSYFRPTIPATADYVIIDMCREKFRPKKDDVRPILEGWLGKGDRVQKGFALLCLKVLGDPASKEKITPLLEEKTKSLERLFYFGNPDKPYKVRKEMLAKAPERTLTIARLAQNALDGIDQTQALNAQKTAGTISAEDFSIREELFLGILDYSGARLVEAVDKMYTEKTGKEPPKPSAQPEPAKKTKGKNKRKRTRRKRTRR